MEEFASRVPGLLQAIQTNLYERALAYRDAHTRDIDTKEEFYAFFTPKNADKPEIHGGFARAHWDGTAETEAKIKEDLKVTIRCIPRRRAGGGGPLHRQRHGRAGGGCCGRSRIEEEPARANDPEPMNTQIPPKLQPPGAGLPWPELMIARYVVFPLECRKLTWVTASRLFHEEGAKVLAVYDALPVARLTEPVLIRRLTGLEDSSRYWSAAMTLEHLNIVGSAIRQLIAGLRRGETPGKVARVQDVKPQGEKSPGEVRAEFVRLLSEAAAESANEPAIAPGMGLRTPHPWFGPIDAYQWHCLLGIHQRIHRTQLEAIRGRLGARLTCRPVHLP